LKKLIKKLAVQAMWRARLLAGAKPGNIHEARFRLQRLAGATNGNQAMQAAFPWGDVEFTDHGAICQQVEAIFFEKIYQFVGTTKSDRPLRIVDCGSNIGLSAIWFLQSYPGCELTCYEADSRLATIAKANIKSAGFSGDQIINAAVWIEDGKIGFAGSGDDKGSVSHESEKRVDCIDLSRAISEETDLLKMDIEGAEFPVLKKLFESGAVDCVQRMAVEFHDVDAHLGEFAELLESFEKSGFVVRFRGGNLPWLEMKNTIPFDFPAIGKGPLYFDLFAVKKLL